MIEPCHINDEFDIPSRADVHNKVCKSLPTKEHEDGHHYCILHLPYLNKSLREFKDAKRNLINEVKAEISTIQAKTISPEEKEIELREVSYDYRYVYFPEGINFNRDEFDAFANFEFTSFQYVLFNFATFTKGASFMSAKFNGNVTFRQTKFFNETYFSKAEFIKDADFSCCRIADNIYFNEAVFNEKANFPRTIFNFNAKSNPNLIASFSKAKFCKFTNFFLANFRANAHFKSAVFIGETRFDRSRFSVEGDASFYRAKFDNDSFFEKTKFRNEVSFNSVVLGNESDTIFRETLFEKYVSFRYSTIEGTLRFINIKQGKKFQLNFQESVVEKANHIAFYDTRLQPHWFINVDLRRFHFTISRWEKSNKTKFDVKSELNDFQELLNIQNKDKPSDIIREETILYQLLRQTFLRIADNSEANSRFEESSDFRKLAFESERLRRKKKISDWLNDPSECRTLPCKIPKMIASMPTDIAHWAYRWTSYYGESWRRALMVLLLGIFLIFPFIYMFPDFQVSTKNIPLEVVVMKECNEKVQAIYNSNCEIKVGGLSFYDAILHSLTSATFQYVEYRKPISGCAEFLTILEKIFVPLQAALLALAIRRKFMR